MKSGLTPEVAIGSTDQHSLDQLILGGPADKLVTFVNSFTNQRAPRVRRLPFFVGLTDYVAGLSTSDIMKALYKGVLTSYQKHNVPFVEIILPDIS